MVEPITDWSFRSIAAQKQMRSDDPAPWWRTLRGKLGHLKIKRFRSPRFEWITSLDIGEGGGATSCETLTSVRQASASNRGIDLEVSGIGFSLHPAHKTYHFSDSLRYFDLWLCMLIHWVRANVKWLIANEVLEQIVSFNMRVLWPISDELFQGHWQPSVDMASKFQSANIWSFLKICMCGFFFFPLRLQREHFMSKSSKYSSQIYLWLCLWWTESEAVWCLRSG